MPHPVVTSALERPSVAPAAASATKMSLATMLLLAAAVALLAGLVELPVLLIKRLVLGHFVFVGPHVVWMAPLGYVMLFVPLALLLYAPARRSPRLVSAPAFAFLFAALGTWGVLLVLRLDLHWIARTILAAAIAVQTARFVGRDPARLPRRVRRWTIGLAAVVVLLATTVSGWLLWTERRSLANLPIAAADAPHVFLLILDTVRAASMSMYGSPDATTPNLERWIEQNGVVFDWAVATSAWSLPTHASLFTGRYPCETGTNWMTPLDRTFPTLAEALADHGYQTAGFAANTRYMIRETGIARGFAHYEDFRITSPSEILRHSSLGAVVTKFLRVRLGLMKMEGYRRAERINHDLLRWLSRASSEQPVFVMLNYMEAHRPYMPPKPFDTVFGAFRQRGFVERATGRVRRQLGLPVDLPPPAAGEAWRDRERRYYHGEIAYLDQQVGRLLDELAERGFLDNALVIVTSDHGEDFDEQGDAGHGDHLYLQSMLRVPLLVAWTGRTPAGARVIEPVSLRHVPATVTDLLGIQPADPFPGTSLARFWERRLDGEHENIALAELTPNARWWAGEVDNMKSIVVDSMQYVRTILPDGSQHDELYNYLSDDWQQEDLIAVAGYQDRLDELRGAMDAIATTCGEERMLPHSLTARSLGAGPSR